MGLSQELRKAIARDGRSLAALARDSGCDVAQLSRFQREQRSLTLPAVEALCKALGVECRLVRRRRTKKGG